MAKISSAMIDGLNEASPGARLAITHFVEYVNGESPASLVSTQRASRPKWPLLRT
jgi:hypothetical protein